MNIFEELWHGNVAPNERDIPKSSRYYQLGKLILRGEDELAPLLSERAKELYNEISEYRMELNDINDCDAFAKGFALGAKIMIEVMNCTEE